MVPGEFLIEMQKSLKSAQLSNREKYALISKTFAFSAYGFSQLPLVIFV